MPVISVTLLPGYEAKVQHRLVQRLAVTARSVIAAADAGTTVFIQEVNTYQRDGKVFTGGGAARPVASEVVMAFLNALAERDLDKAATYLSVNFEMVFPDKSTCAPRKSWSSGHAHATNRSKKPSRTWTNLGAAMGLWCTPVAT